jgi:hypothetical protein
MYQIRRNGLLAYPPVTADRICALSRIQVARELLKNATALGLRSLGSWRYIEERLKEDAKKPLPDGVTENGPSRFRVIHDFSGLGGTYSEEALHEGARQDMGSTFAVRFPVFLDQSFGESLPFATWGSNGEMNVNLAFLPYHKAHQDSLSLTPGHKRLKKMFERYDALLESVCASVKHELRHYMQQTLGASIGRGVASMRRGLGHPGTMRLSPPDKKKLLELRGYQTELREKAASGKATTRDLEKLGKYDTLLYVVDPVEFFPWIGNIIAEIKAETPPGKLIQKQTVDRYAVAKYESDWTGRLQISNGPMFMGLLKKHFPSAFKRALSEIFTWADAYNEQIRESRDPPVSLRLPATPARLASRVLARLDASDPLVAAYARLNRDRFERIAQEYLR